MVLLWLLTITIHNLNFFFSLDTFSFKYFLFLRCCDKAVLMTKLSPHRNKPRLRCSYQNQNQESDLIPFAPSKKIRIPEPGKFLLVESRIWDTAQGIRKPSNDWNPESKFPNDKESVIHIEKSKIPIFWILPWITLDGTIPDTSYNTYESIAEGIPFPATCRYSQTSCDAEL